MLAELVKIVGTAKGLIGSGVTLKQFFQQLHKPLELAIERVAKKGYAAVWTDSFAQFTKSDDFYNLLSRDSSVTYGDIVESFVRYAKFTEYSPSLVECIHEILTEWDVIVRSRKIEQLARATVRADQTIVSLSEKSESHDSRLARLEDLMTKLQLEVLESKQEILRVEFQGYGNRVDDAKRLVDAGQLMAAKQTLEQLRQDLDSKPATDPYLRYRLFTNLGLCSLLECDYQKAEGEFGIALEARTSDEKALANLAQVKLLMGKTEEALGLSSQAIRDGGENPTIVAIHLLCLAAAAKTDEWKETKTAHKVVIDQTAAGQLALGQIHYDDGDFVDSEKYFRRAVELDPENPLAYILLAQVIYKPIRTQLRHESISGNRPFVDNLKLQEAESYCTQALDLLKHTTRFVLRIDARIRRAGIRFLLRKIPEGIADCDVALEEDREDLSAKIQKAQLLLELDDGRLAEVIDLLEKYFDSDPGKVAQVLGRAHYRLHNHEMAAKYFAVSVTDRSDITEICAYVQSVLIHRGAPDALALAKKFRKQGRLHAELLKFELNQLIPVTLGQLSKETVDELISIQTDLINMEPEVADYQLNLVELMGASGQREQAVAALLLVDQSVINVRSKQRFEGLQERFRRMGWLD